MFSTTVWSLKTNMDSTSVPWLSRGTRCPRQFRNPSGDIHVSYDHTYLRCTFCVHVHVYATKWLHCGLHVMVRPLDFAVHTSLYCRSVVWSTIRFTGMMHVGWPSSSKNMTKACDASAKKKHVHMDHTLRRNYTRTLYVYLRCTPSNVSWLNANTTIHQP